MDLDINYKKVKQFAKEAIKKSNRPDFKHRDRYRHSKRVMTWAVRLQELEGGDIDVVKTAALLHDIGWDDKVNHAKVSHDLSKPFLKKIGIDKEQRKKILEAIKYHNARNKKDLHFETYIMQDADLLDELGAMSIIWDAMATMEEKKPSYKKAYERIKKYSGNLYKRIEDLHLESAKKIYQTRLDFIDEFIDELEYELGIEEEEEML
jgi:uncharacterized protein